MSNNCQKIDYFSDILSVLMERELCAPESLAKMSSVCRIICQTVCGLLKVAKTPSESLAVKNISLPDIGYI